MKKWLIREDLDYNENTDEKKNDVEEGRGRQVWWISIEDQTNLLLPFLKHMACDTRGATIDNALVFSHCQLNPNTNHLTI